MRLDAPCHASLCINNKKDGYTFLASESGTNRKSTPPQHSKVKICDKGGWAADEPVSRLIRWEPGEDTSEEAGKCHGITAAHCARSGQVL